MKKAMIYATIGAALGALVGIVDARAQDKPPAAPAAAPAAKAPLLPDFCQGYNVAQALEQQRLQSWASQVLAGRPSPDPSGIRDLVAGVAAYVALPQISGKIKNDDKEYDCTPPAPEHPTGKAIDEKAPPPK